MPRGSGNNEVASLRERIRHSASHVMADAVVQLFPEAKLAIGPPTGDGFYYDFLVSRPFTPEDLEGIEALMRETIARDHPFIRREVSRQEVIAQNSEQPFKGEIIAEIPEDEVISTYTHSGFTDLCEGPHVDSTGKIPALKLLSVAGAYWRGDEHRPMLQRIYGTAFESQEALDDYLFQLEEAQRRDHRKLGRELGLFSLAEGVGPGLPLWLPKGATIRRILERWIVDLELEAGYQHVYTPHLAKVDLYKQSGHWEKFQDSMFPVMERDNEQIVLRPMNCPHHILIYKTGLHSYRELPIRIAELGTMYRYEKSGELSGLSRVRAMTLNDAHIFCRADQVKEEFKAVLNFILEAYSQLGFTSYWHRLSLHDPADPEKYHQDEEMWQFTEQVLLEAMNEMNLPYEEAPGEAAFYGPKLDVQVETVLGKEETVSTIQIDNHLSDRFDLEYIGEDGKAHRPTIIHRSVISTFERLVAHLIEHYAGAFPTWLAPVQAVLIPISDRHLEYARHVESQIKGAGIRVEVDGRSERMNAKVRDAQLQKVPYMLIMGDKEAAEGAVSVRLRSEQDLGPKPLAEVIELLLEDIRSRR